MKTGGINIWAVVVAAVVYWLLGAAWFTLLSKPWLDSIGKTMEQLTKEAVSPGIAYGVALVCNLIIAYVIGWVTRGRASRRWFAARRSGRCCGSASWGRRSGLRLFLKADRLRDFG
jgi:hypothetical protein